MLRLIAGIRLLNEYSRLNMRQEEWLLSQTDPIFLSRAWTQSPIRRNGRRDGDRAILRSIPSVGRTLARNQTKSTSSCEARSATSGACRQSTRLCAGGEGTGLFVTHVDSG